MLEKTFNNFIEFGRFLQENTLELTPEIKNFKSTYIYFRNSDCQTCKMKMIEPLTKMYIEIELTPEIVKQIKDLTNCNKIIINNGGNNIKNYE